jgi:AcrR family transcriptional regulator
VPPRPSDRTLSAASDNAADCATGTEGCAVGTDGCAAGTEGCAAGADDSATTGPIGRRRGLTLEQAIFDAVLQQMNTVGFSGLTMEGVATCARTGKAALYRRWPSKEDLVVDALNHVLPSFDAPPDTGNVRDDIAEVFRCMLDIINSEAGCAIFGLMGELDRDHEFVKTLHARVLAPRKILMTDILDRAAQRGEIGPHAVHPLVAEAGPALIIHQLFTYGPPVDEAYAVDVLDHVVMPLLKAAPPATRART